MLRMHKLLEVGERYLRHLLEQGQRGFFIAASALQPQQFHACAVVVVAAACGCVLA